MDRWFSVRRLGKTVRVKARERIYSKGTHASQLYLIDGGEVFNSITSADGHELVLQRLSQGDIVPITALLGEDLYQTDCVALSDCELTAVGISALRKLLSKDPNLTLNILDLSLQRLRRRSQQLADAALLPVRTRLCKWLVEKAAEQESTIRNGAVIEFNGSERLLGLSLGGASRESISRELSTLSKAGIVARTGKKIKILDAKALVSLVDPTSFSPLRKKLQTHATADVMNNWSVIER